MIGPSDKHGREMRAGDLITWLKYGPYRVAEPWSAPNGIMRAQLRTSEHRSMLFTHDDAERFEVLSRGSPTDPVPERFEPERDAQGRPVLYVHVIYLHMDGSVTRERIREHDAEISAPTPPRDTMVDELRPPVNGAPIDFSRVGSVRDVKDYEVQEPDLAARYAAFRETVERVVAAEAPAAKVVTDRGTIRLIGKGKQPACLVWFRCGDGRESLWGLLDSEDFDKFDAFLRSQIQLELQKVGARAMGKVGAKERG